MTREQEFFLQVLADHIHGRATDPPEGLDWPQIAKYAKSHEVEGIIGYQCLPYLKEHPELANIRERFDKASAAAMFYYANKVQAFEELKNLYRKENAPFFLVKGLAVAELYPHPELRTMGDLDLVLHSEDRDRTHESVLTLGYTHKPNSLVGCYYRANQSLEIHDRLVYDVDESNKARRAFYNSCWEYARPDKENDTYCVLDWSFHFTFLVDHLMKHFTVDGVGFRQFLDLAVTAQRVKELDWRWIEEQLRKVDLWDFTITALAFCEKWWGIKLSIGTSQIGEAEYRESTELIFQNGVFGFDNSEHRINAVAKKADVTWMPKAARPFILMLRMIFQPYETMVMLPYCSFLKGKKYLLPFAWIYRLFYVLFHKRQNVLEVKRIAFDSDEIIDKREHILRDWGL